MWIPPWRSRSCAASYFFVVFLIFALIPGSSADEFSIVSHPSRLSLASGRPVENSPGVRPGAVVTCNRVYIRGLSRVHDLGKFFHAFKLTVVISPGDGLFRLQTVELCLHRNSSLGVGMCPAGDWRKLSKGSMVRSLSPFEHWFLDVRVLPDPSRFVEVTTELEFLSYRVVFMVLGFSMVVMSHSLSQSIAFYYGGAMTVGIILVTLLVLYQGMKLLPTGRKSSLAIVIYSSVVGIAASLLRHISGILRAALVELGIYEDMHKPLGIFLLACLVLAGAWFGYWGVRKLVLTEEGLVDADVAYFVEWAIWIVSGIMILQSSLDTVLAAEALVIAIITSTLPQTCKNRKFLRRLFRRMLKCIYRIFGAINFRNRSVSDHKFQEFGSASLAQTINPRTTRYYSRNLGIARSSPKSPFEDGTYLSSYHNTPQRRRFTKDEWEEFTRDETRKALRELVSSPDFNRWAAENAERITLSPPEDAVRIKRQKRLFGWWS